MTAVRICVSELEKISNWLKENNVADYHIITIETGNAGGIGQYVKAFVETKDSKGIWIDATDYQKF